MSALEPEVIDIVLVDADASREAIPTRVGTYIDEGLAPKRVKLILDVAALAMASRRNRAH